MLRFFAEHPDILTGLKLRGVTRDKTSDAAKALVDQGIEMVQADLLDSSAMSAVLESATYVFANTTSDQIHLKGPALTQALALSPTLKRVVWSSLAGRRNGAMENTPKSPCSMRRKYWMTCCDLNQD